jgi:hypothetical protein
MHGFMVCDWQRRWFCFVVGLGKAKAWFCELGFVDLLKVKHGGGIGMGDCTALLGFVAV